MEINSRASDFISAYDNVKQALNKTLDHHNCLKSKNDDLDSIESYKKACALEQKNNQKIRDAVQTVVQDNATELDYYKKRQQAVETVAEYNPKIDPTLIALKKAFLYFNDLNPNEYAFFNDTMQKYETPLILWVKVIAVLNVHYFHTCQMAYHTAANGDSKYIKQALEYKKRNESYFNAIATKVSDKHIFFSKAWNTEKNSPLIEACAHDLDITKVVTFLLKNGADPLEKISNSPSLLCDTALGTAYFFGNTFITKILEDHVIISKSNALSTNITST